jgi:V/A-type H+-transporting ATPase subunit E
MTQETTVESLEKALFERARKLADEYLARARQTRERMIEEENERLRLREERETLAAEAESERVFRRRVQAVELQLQGELDRHRWDAMESVKAEMRQQFDALQATDGYLDVLGRWLAEGVSVLGENQLVARLNAADHMRLSGQWESFVAKAVPGVQVELENEPGQFAGGVLVRTADDTVRMDNSFEGRLERFDDSINQAIAEALFPGGMAMEGKLHG